MADDAVVRRVHEKMKEAQASDRAKLAAAKEAWRDAVEGLLAEMRKNLPIFIEKAENALVPLAIDLHYDYDRDRFPSYFKRNPPKKAQADLEPTAGWRIRLTSRQEPEFFLVDGRLFRGVYRESDQGPLTGPILPDEAFFYYFPNDTEPANNRDWYTWSNIAQLYKMAGLGDPIRPRPVHYPDYLSVTKGNLR